MAVEAHHLLHAGGQRPQLLAPHEGWAWAGDAACCEAPAATAAGQGQRRLAGKQQQQQQHYRFQQPCAATPAAAAGPRLVAPTGRYAPGPQLCAADASESGVTFGGGGGGAQQQAMAPRKRKRAGEGQPTPALGLASADVAARFQQQLVDVDRLVLQHVSAAMPWLIARCARGFRAWRPAFRDETY